MSPELKIGNIQKMFLGNSPLIKRTEILVPNRIGTVPINSMT